METNLVARNVSSACNSSGSSLWTSSKNIKPIVDANCHTEAIEFVYDQSPIQISPIFYQRPESNSSGSSGQTILFGCPLELCPDERLPPVLEYISDSFPDWVSGPPFTFSVCQMQRIETNQLTLCQAHKNWGLVNEVEQAWTGVEEKDRAFISRYGLYGHLRLLMVGPLLSYATAEG